MIRTSDVQISREKPQSVWGRGLALLIMSERSLRKLIEGYDPPPDKNHVRTIAFALNVEIIELANELGWKPWKREPAPDVAKILDEFADVTAYYGALAALVQERCGVSSEELARAFYRKREVNFLRFSGQVPGFVPVIPQSEEQTPLERGNCVTCEGWGRWDDVECSTCSGIGWVGESE